MVERHPSKLKVAGSNPASRSIADVAQMEERFLGKKEGTGSIPVIRLNKNSIYGKGNF